jgi:hypothetical protein
MYSILFVAYSGSFDFRTLSLGMRYSQTISLLSHLLRHGPPRLSHKHFSQCHLNGCVITITFILARNTIHSFFWPIIMDDIVFYDPNNPNRVGRPAKVKTQGGAPLSGEPLFENFQVEKTVLNKSPPKSNGALPILTKNHIPPQTTTPPPLIANNTPENVVPAPAAERMYTVTVENAEGTKTYELSASALESVEAMYGWKNPSDAAARDCAAQDARDAQDIDRNPSPEPLFRKRPVCEEKLMRQLKPQDITLPRSVVVRLAKGVLPANTQISKDAQLALHKCATVFVSYLASQ